MTFSFSLTPSYPPSNSGPGLYPTFDTSLPYTDIKAPWCGPAFINPAHVMGQVREGGGGQPCRNVGRKTDLVPEGKGLAMYESV